MKNDPLKQFAKLREQLVQEKARLEARLSEIKQVLQDSFSTPSPSSARVSDRKARGKSTGGRNKLSLREAIETALSKGPLDRNGIVEAVQELGYVFETEDPLNSLGSVLYSKKSKLGKRKGKYYLPTNAIKKDASAPAKPQAKRQMTPAQKAKIAASQRARWAARKRAAASAA